MTYAHSAEAVVMVATAADALPNISMTRSTSGRICKNRPR